MEYVTLSTDSDSLLSIYHMDLMKRHKNWEQNSSFLNCKEEECCRNKRRRRRWVSRFIHSFVVLVSFVYLTPGTYMYIPVPVESGCENRLFTSEPMLTLIVVPGTVGSLFPLYTTSTT